MDYTALKTRLSANIKRTPALPDSDLSYFVDSGIDRLNREVKVQGQIARYDATMSTDADGRYLALPALFRHHHRLRLNTTPVHMLEYVPPRLMDSKFIRSGSGRPSWFTVVGEVFEFDVTPDSPYEIEIAYLEKFPKLSASVPTNWLTDHAEDILISACMIVAETFLGRDARLNVWKALYEDQILELNEQEKFYGGRIVARPSGMVV